MSSHADLNSDASRPESGILTPTSDGSLNSSKSCQHGDGYGLPSSNSRKRKCDASALPMEDLLGPTIVVKPHPSSLHIKPRILNPLMLLPREHLPLSCLDLSMPYGDFSASRFYESHIKILDLEGRLGSNVLLARLETKRIIYAIERQDDGLYALCKLGAWVDVGRLAQYATVRCQQRLEPYRPAPQGTASSFPLTTPQLHKENKKRRLAIEEIHSMVKKRARSQSLATVMSGDTTQPILPESGSPGDNTAGNGPLVQEESESKLSNPQADAHAMPEPDIVEPSLSQPSAEDILQNLRTQYVEALYHSMGSLAYFAKGPLSRARAAFHLDCDSNLEMTDLIDFLKSLVMTTVIIDKKYRETMPELISKMKTLIDDSDNADSKPKKRKAKKIRLGKDGLYPSELEHIRRWWNDNKPAVSDDKSATPEEVKYHISCLRRRETLLQMILIMEILALEPLARSKESMEDSQLPGMESQAVTLIASAEAPIKKRSRHNFPMLLDVHADRLCIWQSTTLDEVKALAESQVHSQGHAADNSERHNSDPLKDFCVDIILPFFSARLPDICDCINRKLGGPVIKSPPKPRQSRPASQPKLRPGAPLKKPTATLRREREKTLERVLSNERLRRSVSRGPTTNALALMRSASATSIPGLKRENSEPLMGMIPKREPVGSSLKERPINLFSRSSSTTSSVTEDQKAKKKAEVEAELKEAISALKRPNRALAGKEIVEEAEQRRASTSLSQLKKARKPVRNLAGDPAATAMAVQVKATPANNRFRDVIAAEGVVKALHSSEEDVIKDETDDERVPCSSSVVPSSSATRRVGVRGYQSSPAVTATPIASSRLVQATPARSTTQAPVVDVVPPSSPIMARKAVGRGQASYPAVASGLTLVADFSSPGGGAASAAGVFETPLKPRSAMHVHTPVRPLRLIPRSGDVEVRSNQAVFATLEAKLMKVEGLAPKQDEASPKGGRKQEVSIYQQLGWDDDYDVDG